MENYTWQTPALTPAFGMSAHGSAYPQARRAHTRVSILAVPAAIDAVRVTGALPGLVAWSPPI